MGRHTRSIEDRQSGARVKALKNNQRSLLVLAGLGVVCVLSAYRTRLRKVRYSLKQKNVVITGGSRGLGLALAEVCLARGAAVFLLARDIEELGRADKHLNVVFPSADRVKFVQCDVTSPSSVQAAFSEIAAVWNRVDVLINNAGVIHVGPAENQELSSYHEALETNLLGAVHTAYVVMPQMLARKAGQIVNIASIGGLVAVPHLLPYTTSKFALVGFSRGLSAEMATKGIKVLTVYPWLIHTGSHLKALFTGKSELEYQWFSAGATLPIISMGPQSVSHAIADAIEDGRSELLISPWSHLAATAAQLAPGLTRLLLGLTSRILPAADSSRGNDRVPGATFQNQSPALIDKLGVAAAERWNQ